MNEDKETQKKKGERLRQMLDEIVPVQPMTVTGRQYSRDLWDATPVGSFTADSIIYQVLKRTVGTPGKNKP